MLLRIEEDNFFNYNRKMQLPNTSRDSFHRHDKGMNIPVETVTVSSVPHSMIAILMA